MVCVVDHVLRNWYELKSSLFGAQVEDVTGVILYQLSFADPSCAIAAVAKVLAYDDVTTTDLLAATHAIVQRGV